MPGIPMYEGHREQMYGSHFAGEPMSQSHNAVRPTAEHNVGDVSHLNIPESQIAFDALAACAEPLPHPKADPTRIHTGYPAVRGVRVEFI